MIKYRLKVLLAENDMTQKDLAKMTGIAPNTISKICRGDIKQIPIDALDIMCEVFQCQPSDIFQYYKK